MMTIQFRDRKNPAFYPKLDHRKILKSSPRAKSSDKVCLQELVYGYIEGTDPWKPDLWLHYTLKGEVFDSRATHPMLSN